MKFQTDLAMVILFIVTFRNAAPGFGHLNLEFRNYLMFGI